MKNPVSKAQMEVIIAACFSLEAGVHLKVSF
jgi:hypothetical protein